MSKISIEAFNQLVWDEMGWARELKLELTDISDGQAIVRLPYQESFLRPGGTISGPHMMLLADACMYAVVLSVVGKVELAVTTNLNINFLRKPKPGDLTAEGNAIKIGKRLAVLEVGVISAGEVVAHATGTYSIPPR